MKVFKNKVPGIPERHWSKSLKETWEVLEHVFIHSTRQVGIKKYSLALVVKKEFSNFLTTQTTKIENFQVYA